MTTNHKIKNRIPKKTAIPQMRVFHNNHHSQDYLNKFYLSILKLSSKITQNLVCIRYCFAVFVEYTYDFAAFP
jgi:hypothetical protein